jgi:hypothetical protein
MNDAAYWREYRLKNRERVCATSRARYLKDPTKKKISCAKYSAANRKLVDGKIKKWRNNNPGFHSYSSMLQRCYYVGHVGYPWYGGRGITVCDRWKESFVNFREDMGLRPEGMQLDRINNDGNYEPSNCRWVTPKQNANNRGHK